jgi:flagellar hook assembly protein FlgD
MTCGTIQVGTTAAATANLGPVDMASGAAITGAPGAAINATTVTETGGSTITVGTGGQLSTTGAINLTASTLTVGQNATATTNGNAITASQGSTIDVRQGATLTTGPGSPRGAVTLTTNSILKAGTDSTVNTGTLTLTNSTFDGTAPGTTGVDLNTTGAVSLTDSDLKLGNGPAANLNTNGQPITLTRSRLTTGTGGVTVTAGNLTATGAATPPAANRSTINLGAGTTAGFGTVSLSQSDLVVGANAAVTTGPVSLTDSTASFGNNSSLTANGTLSLLRSQLGGSPNPTMDLPTGLDLSTQGLSLDASTLNLGNGPSALLNTNNQPTTLANGSVLTIGTGAQFNGGSLTTNGGSTVTTGSNSTANLQAVTLNGGSLTAGTSSMFNSSSLAVNGATVALQTNATANTGGLSLTAGHVTLAGGANLKASGQVTVNAAATTSDVTGAGTFNLTSPTAQTVRVADGTPNQDFTVSSQLTSPNAQALVKTGAGRLTLAPTGTGYPNAVQVQAGDVQVDTRTAAVQLAGATASLSGTGTVGSITGSPGAAVGTVTPGVVYAANPAGILTSGTVGSPVADVWGPGTTFAVTLANTSNTHPNPIPGTDYSQLVVNGTLNLGGATLSTNLPAAGPNGIQVNDRFVIISSPNGGLTGTFAGATSVFVGGQKFSIQYSPTEVALVKTRAITQTTLGSSANPAQLKQPVTFTATVTRETGAGPIPTTDQVRFVIDGDTLNPILVNVTVDGSGNGVATLTLSTLPAGTHTVTAEFLGDNSNFLPSGPVSLVPDETIVAPVIGVPSGSATNIGPAGSAGFISPTTSPTVQDAFTVSATVSQVLAVTPTAPTATIRVFSDPGLTTQVRAFAGVVGALSGTDLPLSGTWDGRDTGGAVVADGTYYVVIEFADQWGNVLTSTPLSVVVDNTLPTVSAPTVTAPVIAPGTASTPPTSTTLGSAITEANPSTWVVTVRDALNTVVKTLTGTGTTVGAPQSTWDGTNTANAQVPDGTYSLTLVANDSAGNSSAPVSRTVYVLTVPPTVTVSSGTTVGATTNQTVYGQSVTLTALVSLPASVQGASSLLSGKPVQFNFPGVGSVLSDNLVATADPTVYRASVVVPLQLGAGSYNYTATFPSTADFLQGSAAGTHTVIPADLHVAADNKTRAYGDPNPALTYTATVADLKYADTAAVVTGTPATTATQASNAGAYPITQGSVTAGPNYNVVFGNGTLTITQVPLTIRVNDAIRARFAQNPPFTATFEGLKLADTGAVVANLNLGTTATPNSTVGTYPITAQGTPTATNYFPITVVPGTLTVTGSPTATVVGSGGAPAQARVLEADGSTRTTIPFDPAFAGGIRTAAGDFNKDGIADDVLATGPGRQAFVQVIDGATGNTLFQTTPFEDFTGGAFVAAGDMTGDGVDELVVTPDEGGGPRVVIYRGGDFAPLVSYFAIDDSNFRGGVRPAVGDLNNDGFADLAVSAGFGGGPRISLWDGRKLTSLPNGSVGFAHIGNDFFAFEDTLRNGAFVGIGDVNGDGAGDLVVGAGPGGGPRVKIYSGASLLSVGGAETTPFADFFAGNVDNRGGVKVATKNLDADKFIDVVTGGGAGDRAVATAYRGSALVTGQTSVLYEVDLDGTLNGVFVG